MSEKIVFLVRTSFFSRSRLLTISPESVSIGMSTEGDSQLSIPKDDVDSIRYTARRVRYYFYLYTYFKIDIRGFSGQTIRIRLFSLFGYHKKQIANRYGDILQYLYHHFFRDLVLHYLDLFANGIDFDIAGLVFTQQGIKFSNKAEMIPWQEVDTRDYLSYFSVFSKKDNYNYRAYNYWDDWNTTILNTVIISILKRKELVP